LQQQPYVQKDSVGMTGFCFGGGVTWRVAIGLPELRAAVPYYGPHPSTDEVKDIQAAVLGIYADRDQRITGGVPDIEAAMQASNKIYEKIIYPNTDHAFHNDTGQRYNPEAAQDAWAKTIAWFDQYLRA
jgi:carboxymethylenebutenolidase